MLLHLHVMNKPKYIELVRHMDIMEAVRQILARFGNVEDICSCAESFLGNYVYKRDVLRLKNAPWMNYF